MNPRLKDFAAEAVIRTSQWPVLKRFYPWCYDAQIALLNRRYLGSMPGVLDVRQIGSAVGRMASSGRGACAGLSDIDLAVILKDLPWREELETTQAIYRHLARVKKVTPIHVDLFVWDLPRFDFYHRYNNRGEALTVRSFGKGVSFDPLPRTPDETDAQIIDQIYRAYINLCEGRAYLMRRGWSGFRHSRIFLRRIDRSLGWIYKRHHGRLHASMSELYTWVAAQPEGQSLLSSYRVPMNPDQMSVAIVRMARFLGANLVASELGSSHDQQGSPRWSVWDDFHPPLRTWVQAGIGLMDLQTALSHMHAEREIIPLTEPLMRLFESSRYFGASERWITRANEGQSSPGDAFRTALQVAHCSRKFRAYFNPDFSAHAQPVREFVARWVCLYLAVIHREFVPDLDSQITRLEAYPDWRGFLTEARDTAPGHLGNAEFIEKHYEFIRHELEHRLHDASLATLAL